MQFALLLVAEEIHVCWGCSSLFVLAEAYKYQNTNMQTQSLLKHMPCHKPMSAMKTLKNFPDQLCTFGPWLQLSFRKPEWSSGRQKQHMASKKKENNPSSCYNQLQIEALMVGQFKVNIFHKTKRRKISRVFMCCLEGVTGHSCSSQEFPTDPYAFWATNFVDGLATVQPRRVENCSRCERNDGSLQVLRQL